jgi:hypothetical protein
VHRRKRNDGSRVLAGDHPKYSGLLT